MNQEVILQKVRALLELYKSGQIPTLQKHEVHPELPLNDRLNYLYFTLPVCLNFQRSSPAMWEAAFATFNDPATNYLFYPEKVALASYQKVQNDLLKHKLALQKNKHTEIWTRISGALHEFYNNDPKNLLEEGGFDVAKVIQLLQKTYRNRFPYLSGPKLSNYWLFILSRFTDVKFKNMHEISIIPDTHVIQSTVHLGLADTKVSSLKVEDIWKELLKDSGISPVEVHPVLWNWSRNGFKPEVKGSV